MPTISFNQNIFGMLWLAFHENEIDNDPGRDETEQVPPFDATNILDGIRGVQGGSEPEVLSLTGVITFSNGHIGIIQGTGGPGEGELKYFTFLGHLTVKFCISLDIILLEFLMYYVRRRGLRWACPSK